MNVVNELIFGHYSAKFTKK